MIPNFRAAVAAVTLLLAGVCQAVPLWFADDRGLHQIDTDANRIVLNVSLDQVQDLALDPKDNSLWALTARKLVKYSSDGHVLVQLYLAHDLDAARRNSNDWHDNGPWPTNDNCLFVDTVGQLALDPNDDSVWLSGGNRLFHLDANGARLADFTAPETLQDIGLAQDRTLWALAQTKLLHYSGTGLAGSVRLHHSDRQSRFLAVDDGGGVLWLAGSRQATQLSLADPSLSLLRLNLPDTVSAIALAPDSDWLWVAGSSTLSAYARDGTRAAQADLHHLDITDPQSVDYDAASRSLWLGHHRGISRFSAQGQFARTFPADDVNAISRAPAGGGVTPRLALIQPPDNALTNNPQPLIRYQYDASCSGQPCGYPPSSFASYVLTATLDGQPIGGQFVFDPATAQASYAPPARLPEGSNTLSAFVTDSSGRHSSTVNSSFTVDTIAPQFLNYSPANGSVFLAPNITIQGSIDDPQGIVFLQNLSDWNGTGANPAIQNFSYQVTLHPGANVFNLTATDKAGNVTPLQLTYVLNTFTLSIATPAPNLVVDDNTVTVTGTFSGDPSPTITVNGVAATLSGSSYSATVPLHFGANLITVTGTASSGASTTQTVTVTSTFPSVSISSPAGGSTLAGNGVLVTGALQAPANSGVVVNGVVAVVDASGNFYANNVPLLAGSNTVTAIVTTLTGKSGSASVTVTSSGPATATITASPVQGVAPLTVSFSAVSNTGNPLAGFQANPGGPGSQAPSPDPSALFAFTYTQPGTYQASVQVVDTAGNPAIQTIVVSVKDPAQMDQMFAAIWNGMNAALVAGDIPTALTYLNAAGKEKYASVFTTLLPNMPSIVGSYSTLQRSSISQNIGEYAVNRTINGVNRIFFIYFLQDRDDGVWRIDSM